MHRMRKSRESSSSHTSIYSKRRTCPTTATSTLKWTERQLKSFKFFVSSGVIIYSSHYESPRFKPTQQVNWCLDSTFPFNLSTQSIFTIHVHTSMCPFVFVFLMEASGRLGVQHLARGFFNMRAEGARNRTTDGPISRRASPAPEPQSSNLPNGPLSNLLISLLSGMRLFF